MISLSKIPPLPSKHMFEIGKLSPGGQNVQQQHSKHGLKAFLHLFFTFGRALVRVL